MTRLFSVLIGFAAGFVTLFVILTVLGWGRAPLHFVLLLAALAVAIVVGVITQRKVLASQSSSKGSSSADAA